jgi:CBS domain-containing protein
MTTNIASPTTLAAWRALEAHYPKVRELHLRKLFADDPKRGERMTVEALGIYLDYSKHRITDETIRLLLQLTEESGLRARIEAMFRGEKINVTEQRAVLHVALRSPKGQAIVLDGEDVVPQVHAVLDKMADFSTRVRSGQWKGHTGRPLRNVINIGIGGSDLGPVMAYEALRYYSQRDLTFRFVSNIDGTDFAEATRDLNAEETLFIISSKTFTTLETMAALAYLISGRRYTIYHEQVPSRVDSPAHQGEFIQDVLKGLTVGGTMAGAGRREFTSIAPGTTFESVVQLVPKTTQQVFPVVDSEGRFCGLLDLDDIRQFLYKAEMGQVVIVEDIMTERVEPLRPDTDLSSVMARFARSRYEELPIVDAEAKVIGLLSLQDIVTAYDRRLAKLRSPGV